MNAFIDSFVPAKPLTRAELPSLNDRYDLFLSGSDQLWNPDIQQGDYYYLQDFVTDNRKKAQLCFQLWAGRNCRSNTGSLPQTAFPISVHHGAGAGGGRPGGRPAAVRPAVVLDPTLLLTAPQWEALLPPRRKKGKYLFVYRLTYSTLLTPHCGPVAKGNGAPHSGGAVFCWATRPEPRQARRWIHWNGCGPSTTRTT